MGGFPDRQLTNFPNLGVSSAAYYCSAEVWRIGFRGLSNARIPWATRKLCFLILLAGYVDPDKVLRRYHGLDLEVKGFVEGAKGSFKCSLSLECEVCLRQF